MIEILQYRQVAFLLLFAVLCCSFTCVSGQFEETRCKCLCNSRPNDTVVLRRSYVMAASEQHQRCECLKVVIPQVKAATDKDVDDDAVCAACSCKYQTRNTAVIKVCVIGIICVITFLVAYMIVLLFLDPACRQKAPRGGSSYQVHENEEDDNIFARNPPMPSNGAVQEDASSMGSGAACGSTSEAASVGGRQRKTSILDKVGHQREKWMLSVEKQRQNTFTNHTMLN